MISHLPLWAAILAALLALQVLLWISRWLILTFFSAKVLFEHTRLHDIALRGSEEVAQDAIEQVERNHEMETRYRTDYAIYETVDAIAFWYMGVYRGTKYLRRRLRAARYLRRRKRRSG